jgi:nucleotidyltransferase/DNA polymerase involved in DNA repair
MTWGWHGSYPARHALNFLVSAFGKNGISLWNKANGIDESPVMPYAEQKSISTESTFEEDTIDVKRLKSILIAMVEKVAFQLREQKKLTSCITVKIRYSNLIRKQNRYTFLHFFRSCDFACRAGVVR